MDNRGLIHENDAEKLLQLGTYVETTFAENILSNAHALSEQTRSGFSASALLDGNLETYWAAKDQADAVNLTLRLENPQKANVFEVREFLPYGQRIKGFELEVLADGLWKKIKVGTTVGSKRLIRFDTATIEALRFTITETKAAPLITEMGLYLEAEI